MKPRTLARHALKLINSGLFSFDSDERKTEAIQQMKSILTGKPESENNPNDPIVEFHIGVFIPNFDYPIIPVDSNNDPIVWEEDGEFPVPGLGTHTFKGVGISGEKYYMSYLTSLSPFREATVKVDRYTDMDRAAYALVCTMSQILNKETLIPSTGNMPIKMDYEELIEHWNSIPDHKDKTFEDKQHKLYIKWLQKWINIHGKNPETHMRVLRTPKKSNI